jgi:PKD repeat protein
LEQDGQIRTVEATNTREDADIKALKDYDPLQDTRIKGVEEKNAKQDTDIKAVQDYNVDQDADIVAMEKENTDLKAGLQYMTKRQYFGMTISDDWETFTSGSTKGLRTYVDLSHLNLKNVPHVTVSLEGDNDVWKVIGGSYLYTLDNKGFSVFIRYDSEQVLTLADAIQNDWHLDYTVTSIPIARFDTTISNLYVQGDGSKSSYEDQPLTRLIWDFGDNTAPVIGSAPSHSYSADGTYKITLTGEDKYGVINKVSKKVTVGASTATVFWNFDNSITTGASSNPAISGVASSVGGSIQLWWVSPDRVLFTQFFGQNYLYIAITTTKIVKLSTVSFLHYHNHNPGYPNEHPYQVRLQISSTVNSNSAYSPIPGATFTADPITHMTVTTVNLGETLLQPGTHYIRWLPNIATTSSGYFAIDNINLTVKVQN